MRKKLSLLMCFCVAIMMVFSACQRKGTKDGDKSSSALSEVKASKSGKDNSESDTSSDGSGSGSSGTGTTNSSGKQSSKGGDKTSKNNNGGATSQSKGETTIMEIDLHAEYTGNVKNCGVAGDGKTDDTAAIQKLLDNWPEKCTLYFPRGTYLISSPLKIRSGTNIIGEPTDNGVGGSVIKAAKSMNYLLGAADAKLTDTIFMNLTLDGGKKSGYKLNALLDAPGFCSLKLANIKMINCTGYGLHSYQGTKSDPTWISIVENIEASNVDGYALEMINSDTAINHVKVVGGKGILDYNYGGNVYNDIYVENSTGSGLTIGRPDRVENGHICILNSTFKNNRGYGLQLTNSKKDEKRVQVEGCDFSNNSLGDVGMQNVKGCTFYGNNFRSSRAFANISTSDWVTLVGNSFAQGKISSTGYMVNSDNKFNVGSFSNKGCSLDKDVYNYKRVYRSAALKSDSGRVISLEECGAVPSAFEDNSNAFKKAITTLGANGGIIYVSKGEYGIGATVKIPSNIIIVGEGANGTVNFAPSNNITTMFEIAKGAQNVLFLNCNITNPGGSSVEYFVKGDSVNACQFDTIQCNSNIVNNYKNVVYLVNSKNSVVNSMICGIGNGGNMVYLKNCDNCTVQTSYISRGNNGTVVDGGKNHHMFNNHYDWFYESAVTFKNGANNCVFNNNYCDINQRVVKFDYSTPTNANIRVSSSISRESGIPARNELKPGAERRQISEIFIQNAQNVQIIGFSSDVWWQADNKNLIELSSKNDYLTVIGNIAGGIYNSAQSGSFGSHSVETNNFIY